MKFNICLGNRWHFKDEWGAKLAVSILIEDIVRFLRLSLEELGHVVRVSRTYVDPQAMNIFFDGFYNVDKDVPAQLQERGFRFGIMSTEVLTADGRYNPMELDDAGSREIFAQFGHSASLAEFVWCLMEGGEPICSQFNPNSHPFPMGHLAQFANLTEPKKRLHDFDFSFAGWPTDRRGAIIAELQRQGFTVAASQLDPDYIRRSVLEASKVSLSIQKSTQHSIFSITRIAHAIMNRVPIVVEFDGPLSYLSKYCVTAPPAHFIDTCVEFVRRSDLQAYTQDAHDRFAREMPMRPIMDRLLKESSIVPLGAA